MALCPTSFKRSYNSEAEAVRGGMYSNILLYAYKCECGKWHLSKQSPAVHDAKVNSPPSDASEFE